MMMMAMTDNNDAQTTSQAWMHPYASPGISRCTKYLEFKVILFEWFQLIYFVSHP